jgi:hypothetical protein
LGDLLAAVHAVCGQQTMLTPGHPKASQYSPLNIQSHPWNHENVILLCGHSSLISIIAYVCKPQPHTSWKFKIG